MTFVAVIPKCDQPTPQEVLDVIPRAIGVVLTGVYMKHADEESYLRRVHELYVCLSALLVIPNVMRWNVAPYIREAMGKTNFHWSVRGDEDANNKTKKAMGDAIDALLDFCN